LVTDVADVGPDILASVRHRWMADQIVFATVAGVQGLAHHGQGWLRSFQVSIALEPPFFALPAFHCSITLDVVLLRSGNRKIVARAVHVPLIFKIFEADDLDSFVREEHAYERHLRGQTGVPKCFATLTSSLGPMLVIQHVGCPVDGGWVLLFVWRKIFDGLFTATKPRWRKQKRWPIASDDTAVSSTVTLPFETSGSQTIVYI
jgi:hypothetical protein